MTRKGNKILLKYVLRNFSDFGLLKNQILLDWAFKTENPFSFNTFT